MLFLIFGGVYYFLGRDSDIKIKIPKGIPILDSITKEISPILQDLGRKKNRVHPTRSHHLTHAIKPTRFFKPAKVTTAEKIRNAPATGVTRLQYYNNATPHYAMPPYRTLSGR